MELDYTYTPEQVRVLAEGQTTLTPLEAVLLDHIDELNNFGEN